MAKEKVVLAYSGGLDTSVIMTWLKENYDYDVIAVCCNAGQKEDFDAIEKKALATGAIKAITIDLREEFITDYIWPTLKAGAIYENEYMLGTSMARPLMAKKLVEVAEAGRRVQHRSRLHRKGKRPGSFRNDDQGSESGHQDHRSLEILGLPLQRRSDRICKGTQHSDQPDN